MLAAPLLAAAVVAGLAVAALPRPPSTDGAELAARRLGEALPAARAAAGAALWPESQRAVADFAALQVGAAEMTLAGLRWEEHAAADPTLSAVDLVLEALGPADNAPILVDGLLQGARVCVLRHLWVSAEAPGVRLGLRLRFFRPTTLHLDGASPLEEALLSAHELRQIERFAAQLPLLSQRAAGSGAMARIALPGLLRSVGASPRGWMGLDLSGSRPELLTDPEGLSQTPE